MDLIIIGGLVAVLVLVFAYLYFSAPATPPSLDTGEATGVVTTAETKAAIIAATKAGTPVAKNVYRSTAYRGWPDDTWTTCYGDLSDNKWCVIKDEDTAQQMCNADPSCTGYTTPWDKFLDSGVPCKNYNSNGSCDSYWPRVLWKFSKGASKLTRAKDPTSVDNEWWPNTTFHEKMPLTT